MHGGDVRHRNSGFWVVVERLPEGDADGENDGQEEQAEQPASTGHGL